MEKTALVYLVVSVIGAAPLLLVVIRLIVTRQDRLDLAGKPISRTTQINPTAGRVVLRDLLFRLFETPADLWLFISEEDDLRFLRTDVNWDRSLADVTESIVTKLEHRGLLELFLSILQKSQPLQAGDIQSVRGYFMPQNSD